MLTDGTYAITKTRYVVLTGPTRVTNSLSKHWGSGGGTLALLFGFDTNQSQFFSEASYVHMRLLAGDQPYGAVSVMPVNEEI